MARRKPAPNGITLRLNQNAFVRGELYKEGTEFTFSKEEAEKRLRDTQYWDLA